VIVGVFGPGYFRGKKYENYDYVAQAIGALEGIVKIISGGGKGAEEFAQKYAARHGIDHDVIPPNIKLHGTENAFIYRNQEIIKSVDLVVLLWDGKDAKYHRLMADAVDQQKRLLLLHVE
jgi:hypothetical protein